MQIHELAAKLRGYPNTQVDVDIYRPSTKVTQLTTLTREIISIETVQYKYLGDHTGYIRISSFSKQTNDQLEEALEKGEKDGVQALDSGSSGQPRRPAEPIGQSGQPFPGRRAPGRLYTGAVTATMSQQYESEYDDRWSQKTVGGLDQQPQCQRIGNCLWIPQRLRQSIDSG